jgi:hypothetical protein
MLDAALHTPSAPVHGCGSPRHGYPDRKRASHITSIPDDMPRFDSDRFRKGAILAEGAA